MRGTLRAREPPALRYPGPNSEEPAGSGARILRSMAGGSSCGQITIREGAHNYRFPIPAEFNKRGSFGIKAPELPVPIPYDADVKISVIETNRRGETILAQSPVRYRAV